MNLTQLICQARNITIEIGENKGKCVLCGETSDHGFKPNFGNNFTCYEKLQGGNIICPICHQIEKERQEYRRSMWIVTPTEFKTFKKKDAKNILLNPPEPPFALYLTRTWKKQGWISLIDKINNDNKIFWVGLDYDIILIDLKETKNDFKLIKKLRELKISKDEIKTGKFKVKSLEKLDGNFNIIKDVLKRAGSPNWELEVYLNE